MRRIYVDPVNPLENQNPNLMTWAGRREAFAAQDISVWINGVVEVHPRRLEHELYLEDLFKGFEFPGFQ